MNRGGSSSCLGNSSITLWRDVPFLTENTEYLLHDQRYLWLQSVQVLSATLDASGVQDGRNLTPQTAQRCHPIAGGLFCLLWLKGARNTTTTTRQASSNYAQSISIIHTNIFKMPRVAQVPRAGSVRTSTASGTATPYKNPSPVK